MHCANAKGGIGGCSDFINPIQDNTPFFIPSENIRKQ